MTAGRPVLILILVLAGLALVAMIVLPPILDPEKPAIPYEVLEHQSNPPKYFSYVLAVNLSDGKLPDKEKFLAVVKKLADKSLMDVGAVNNWRIAFRRASAPESPPFLVYSYDLNRDRLITAWHPENLPQKLRGQAPQ